MKKIITKLLLVFVLMIPTISFTLQNNTIEVAAKISGDYAYDMVDETSIQITNYNGSEVNLVVPEKIDGFNVVKIGYGAFAECKSIETVSLPNTLKTIDYYAFSQCTQLKEINLPSTITSIGRYAFAGCHSMQKAIIPEKIRSLGYGVFFDCINLSEVTLPEGLESIGGIAFGSCRSLQEIQLPSTLQTIEGNAFNDCTSLSRIELPNSVKSIGSGVFLGCLSLKEVILPESIVGIGQNAFQNCIALESIDLPESITGIGYGAFTGCVALKEITIPSKVTALGNATFSGCSSLETINIPDTIVSIGEYAFSGCTSLKTIHLPESVTEIGASAFQSCSNLATIKLPKNLKMIPISLFRYCDKLESVVIPNGVTQVNATAFADCATLYSVTFPNSIGKTPTGDPNIGSRILSNSPNAIASVIENSEAHRYVVRTGYDYRLLESGMNFNTDKVSMRVEENVKLSVLLAPYTVVDNSLLKWNSSNPSVASVDGNGVITALNPGTATITASNTNGQSAQCVVSVNNTEIAINSVVLNKTNTTIRINSAETLRATINPITTTQDRTITWHSDNPEVALVSSTGLVSALQPGKATITATTSNGLSKTCEVNVISEIVSVTLNKTALVLEEGVSQSLRATINPSNTTDSKVVTWRTSNARVATVDQNGEISAVSEGYATITAVSANGKRAECKITVVRPVELNPITSVSLNKDKLALVAGREETLIPVINPTNTTDDKTLTWTSSNKEVATVDENGKVKALTSGTTTITVTTTNNKSATCVVSVNVPIEGVSLNKDKLTLEATMSETLIATINPDNTSDDKTLRWHSSNPEVATVDENGKVKALTSGTTIISVTTSNDKSATCEVIVTIPIEGVTLNKDKLTLEATMFETLIATINPNNTSDAKTLRWHSSNPEVASVTQDGKVVAITKGTTTITVTTSNDKSATCEVIVTIPIKNVTLNKTNLSLKVSASETLIATINPLDTSDDKTLTWSSSDDNVAKVDSSGKVIARASGSAIITVTTTNNKSASCEVNVYAIHKDELKTLIDKADDASALDYTKDSFDVMTKALNKAKEVYQYEDATQRQVDEAISSLKAAYDALVIRASEADIYALSEVYKEAIKLESDFSEEDFSHMKELIEATREILESSSENLSAEAVSSIKQLLLDEQDYLMVLKAHYRLLATVEEAYIVLNGDLTYVDPVAVQALKDSVTKAEKLLVREDASAQEMNAASDELLVAIENAQPKVSRTALTLLVEEVKEYKESAFTSSTWKVFKEAYDEAVRVLASVEATQANVDQAYNALLKAKEQLVSTVNKDLLRYQIAKIDEILANKSKYITSTIRNLNTLVVAARAVDEKADVKQSDVDAMNQTLMNALIRVRLKPN